jgi:hypothetical protein
MKKSKKFRVVQPGQLRQVARAAGLHHLDRAIIDLCNVEISAPGDPLIAFCNLKAIPIKSRLEKGNGEPLPLEVSITGISFPGVGRFNLRGVELHANECIHIRATADTVCEPIGS